ncbi:MAG: PAS domain-containing sensor histidine kinase [Chitinophagaceae bacterium]|nr:MAG: PAS domain-containing sensor histidine kinase [Chitinophagaceae bacterium]
MEASFDTAPCLYFACDDGGRLLDVNETLCRRLGYRRDELAGQPVDLLFTLATRIFHQTHFAPLLRLRGSAEEIYITLRTKSGEELPVLVNAAGADGSTGLQFVAIPLLHRKQFEDELIAARKAAEDALRENTELQRIRAELQAHTALLDEQMSVVERQNEELRQVSRVVTHDLQEPIRKLMVFLNMLREEGPGKPAVLDKVLRVSGELRSVVAGLQQYVWLTDAFCQPADQDLGHLLLLVQQELAAQYPDVQLQVSHGALPPVHGDRKQIHLLFYQLLDNAVRFRSSPTEARVRLAVTRVTHNRFRNLKDRYDFAEYLKLQLSDEGVGFDPAYAEQAFALFRRLHPQSGHGIGLALCRKVIENHQGSISIDSMPGSGSTVTFFLPCTTAGAGAPDPKNEYHEPEAQDHTLR